MLACFILGERNVENYKNLNNSQRKAKALDYLVKYFG
jgi:hypothetical protein